MISGFRVVWIQTSKGINDLRLTLKYFWLELEGCIKVVTNFKKVFLCLNRDMRHSNLVIAMTTILM